MHAAIGASLGSLLRSDSSPEAERKILPRLNEESEFLQRFAGSWGEFLQWKWGFSCESIHEALQCSSTSVFIYFGVYFWLSCCWNWMKWNQSCLPYNTHTHITYKFTPDSSSVTHAWTHTQMCTYTRWVSSLAWLDGSQINVWIKFCSAATERVTEGKWDL